MFVLTLMAADWAREQPVNRPIDEEKMIARSELVICVVKPLVAA